MKTKALFFAIILSSIAAISQAYAQAESGNTGPSGGGSGVSGTASGNMSGQPGPGTGGKGTTGDPSTPPATTNVPPPAPGPYNPNATH